MTTATGAVLAMGALGAAPAFADTALPTDTSASTQSAPADSSSTAASTATTTPAAATTASAAPAPSAPAAPAAPAPTKQTAKPAPKPSTAPAPTPTQSAAPSADATSTPSAEPSDGASTAATDEATAPAAAPTAPASSETSARGGEGDHKGGSDKGGKGDHGTGEKVAPSYTGSSSSAAPTVLPSVAAGTAFTADLRAQDAKGATYTLTTVEGTPVALPEGITFSHGILSGTPTYAGTFTAKVTATNDCGSASEWVRMTVTSGAALGIGVVVHSVPAAADGSYTWIDGNGWATPGEVTVDQYGSITLVPWIEDAYGNQSNATSDQSTSVTSDYAQDVIVRGDGSFTLTFPHASMHLITVTAGGKTTTFCVTVNPVVQTNPTDPTGPTTPTDPTDPTNPTVPVTPGGSTGPTTGTISVPVAQSVPIAPAATVTPVADPAPTRTQALAYTGSDSSAPLGWALGLLAAGAAITGIRVARGRHRA